jgi:hypothetical protein
MKIIGIAAPKGSGKTTFADFIKKDLEDKYQKRVKILPFAAPLKRACWMLFGGSEKNWFGTDAEKSVTFEYWNDRLGEAYSTPRRIMQSFGTDVVRNNVDPNFWIMSFNKMLLDWSGVDIVIVDDVRFTNEAEYIRAVYGKVIHLTRNSNVWSQEHESEMGPEHVKGDVHVDFTNLVDMKEYAKTFSQQTLLQQDAKPL